MECLDEETILAFCRTADVAPLSAAARAAAEAHIGTCDECRQLVSAVARSSFVDPEEREDLPPGPLLRSRVDPAMAATTPSGGSGLDLPPRPASSPVQPGQILAGKFKVERVLGMGGMGIVVAARHTQLDQRVALKFLLPVACEVPGAVARFLREGKAAARITSEHVARVMDTGVLDGGAPYLVMEYLEGSDLAAVVQQRGPVSADDAVEFVLQACEAIVEAHEIGIIHRDLKPANLFLSKRADGSPLVKVLDFGISKVEGAGSRSQLTSASVMMGSPRYMSPEQMLSAKDVDARTDVWALGVILYELVTAKPVWHADTMQGLCALIASTPAPSLLTSAPDAPKILADAVARCLAKSRDERIASIADLALALEPIAPATARTSIDRILRVARRTRSVGRGTKPKAAAARAVAAAAAGPADRATSDARRAPARRVGMLLAIGVAALLLAGIAINAARHQRATRAPAGPGEQSSIGLKGAIGAAGPIAPTTSAAAPLAQPTVTSSTAELGGTPAPVVTSSASVAHRSLRPPPMTTTHPNGAAPPSASERAATVPIKSEPTPPAPSGNRALTDRK